MQIHFLLGAGSSSASGLQWRERAHRISVKCRGRYAAVTKREVRRTHSAPLFLPL